MKWAVKQIASVIRLEYSKRIYSTVDDKPVHHIGIRQIRKIKNPMDVMEGISDGGVSLDDSMHRFLYGHGQKQKIGEIFRWNDSSVSMQCEHCLQQFKRFIDFVHHMDEHLMSGGLQTIKHEVNDTLTYNVYGDNEYVLDDIAKPAIIDDDDIIVDESDNDWLNGSMVDEDYWTQHPPTTDWMDIKDPMDTMDSSTSDEKFSQIASDDDKFKLHEHYTTVDGMFKCLTCGHKMKRKPHLFDHLRTHSKRRDVFCPVCKRSFSTATYVVKHCIRAHKQKCSVEDVRSAQVHIAIDWQLDENELMPMQIPRSYIIDGQYRCLYCDKWFVQLKYVQRHIRMVHIKVVELNDIQSGQPKAIEANEMDSGTMGDVINTNIDMMPKHQREEHSSTLKRADSVQLQPTMITEYKCEVCPKMYHCPILLKNHVAIHNKLHHVCPYCDHKTKHKRYLYDHIIMAHNIPRSQIAPASIRTITADVDMHRGKISSYECYICKRGATRPSVLKAHMEVAHVDENARRVQCSICGAILKTRETYRHHMGSVHRKGSRAI